MQTWKDIVTAAVVGTDQQDFVVTRVDDQLGSLLSQLERSDREERLLNAASIVTLFRRAGIMTALDAIELLEVSAEEESNRVNRQAGQHLKLMLEGQFRSVLPEWLRAVASVRARVPEEHLPSLLDEGSRERSLRELIAEVCGRRGEWLVQQNPDWNYLTVGDDKEVWDTGNREQRLSLLGELRKSDPAKARELLAGSFAQEAAKDRATFIEKFSIGIADDDEEFLNQALQDRSGDVRRAARVTLASLANSRFTKRIKDLISQVVNFKKPLIGKARVEVSLPDETLDWLKHHEVEIDNPPRTISQSLGPKGWYLKELVALTPVNHWVELWKKSPREIVNAALEGEWATAFSEGLVRSVQRDRDPDWIEALIAHWLNDSKPEVTYTSPLELSRFLPIARLEALIFSLMKAASKGLNDTHPVLQVLLAHPGQWSDELSRIVIASIKIRIPRIQKDETIDWQTRSALKKFAHHISPALFDELSVGWPMDSEAWSAWTKAVDEFQSVLAFRRDIYNAISTKEPNQ